MLTFSYSSFSNNLALKDFKGLMVVNYDLEDLKDIEVDETGKVSNKEKEFLEKIAEWVVADKVVRMMELNREGVSGLYNQLKFHGDWDRYMNRFHLTGETQGLINIDLDNLKKLNSNYGHLAGDKVLSEIGKMLREMESKDVRPYRQGGDEFAIIIRGDLECARQYGNKLLEEFRNIWVPEGADPRTASIGIAMTEQGIMDGDEWAQRADDALYAAKFKGRNQVCVHDEYDPKILLNRDEL
jgi:diguanylate cyclase (GGDEF)-like protein